MDFKIEDIIVFDSLVRACIELIKTGSLKLDILELERQYSVLIEELWSTVGIGFKTDSVRVRSTPSRILGIAATHEFKELAVWFGRMAPPEMIIQFAKFARIGLK